MVAFSSTGHAAEVMSKGGFSRMRSYVQRRPWLGSDHTLHADIERALSSSPSFKYPAERQALRVAVRGGIVFLEGNVRTMLKAVEADLLAHEVPGVVEVRNGLVIDDDLEQEVVSALRHDPVLDSAEVVVETELGVIRLHGRVPSPEQGALALLVARQVPAVDRVECMFDIGSTNIIVDGWPTRKRPRLELRWNKPEPP